MNTTEHLSLLDRTLAVGLSSDECHEYGMVIQPFRYEVSDTLVQRWPQKYIDEFLCESLDFDLNKCHNLLFENVSSVLEVHPARP